MQQQNRSYQQRDLPFVYLNTSKPKSKSKQ